MKRALWVFKLALAHALAHSLTHSHTQEPALTTRTKVFVSNPLYTSNLYLAPPDAGDDARQGYQDDYETRDLQGPFSTEILNK
jgi:hypothetical protein